MAGARTFERAAARIRIRRLAWPHGLHLVALESMSAGQSRQGFVFGRRGWNVAPAAMRRARFACAHGLHLVALESMSAGQSRQGFVFGGRCLTR